jgi:hypothetical protein
VCGRHMRATRKPIATHGAGTVVRTGWVGSRPHDMKCAHTKNKLHHSTPITFSEIVPAEYVWMKCVCVGLHVDGVCVAATCAHGKPIINSNTWIWGVGVHSVSGLQTSRYEMRTHEK